MSTRYGPYLSYGSWIVSKLSEIFQKIIADIRTSFDVIPVTLQMVGIMEKYSKGQFWPDLIEIVI